MKTYTNSNIVVQAEPIKPFKVGDKVYCPILGNKIFTVRNANPVPNTPDGSDGFILTVGQNSLFDRHGYYMFSGKLPLVFHATPENRQALNHLYNIELEELPIKPTRLEIIQILLAKQKYVLCAVASTNPDPCISKDYVDLIQNINYDSVKGIRFCGEDGYWNYAIPINPATGEPLTEIPRDITIPTPYQGEMRYGQEYYVPDLVFEDMYDIYEWRNSDIIDNRLLNRGLIHLTKENAIAHAKALLALSG